MRPQPVSDRTFAKPSTRVVVVTLSGIAVVVGVLLMQGSAPDLQGTQAGLPAASGSAVSSPHLAQPARDAAARAAPDNPHGLDPSSAASAAPARMGSYPALPPYGAAADPSPRDGGTFDSTRLQVRRVAGADLDPQLLGFLRDALPAEVAERIRRDGVTTFDSDEREPMIPFASLPSPRTDCTVLWQLSGPAILRVGESGRILGARMLSDPTATVPEAVYGCEFGPIPNNGSHSVFQTLTPLPEAAVPTAGLRF